MLFVLPAGRGPFSCIICLCGGMGAEMADEANPCPEAECSETVGARQSGGSLWWGIADDTRLACYRRFNLAIVVRRASCAAAPFLIAPRHAGRSWARVSHELWSMPKPFREFCFVTDTNQLSSGHERGNLLLLILLILLLLRFALILFPIIFFSS